MKFPYANSVQTACVCIAAIIAATAFLRIIWCWLRRKRCGVKELILWMVAVNAFAFAPVIWAQSGKYSPAAGIIYVMQIFGMGFKYDEFIAAVNAAIDANWYRSITVVLYAASPLLAGAFILDLVADVLKKFTFGLSLAKDTYIFTELNEKSLALADSCKRWNSEVVFLGTKNETDAALSERCSERGYRILDYTPEKVFGRAIWRLIRFLWLGTGSVSIYFMDEDEKKSIDKTAKFLKEFETKKKIYVRCKAYLVSVLGEAETLVDFYKEKVGMQLRLINPAQIISYKILEEYPLYAIPARKFEGGYNVTVIGMGNVGTQIAKDVIWCGQRMNGGAPTVNMVDIRPQDKTMAEFEYKFPELNKKNYDIKYFSADARSKELDDLLAGKLADSECFVVCLGNDLANAEVAREIRAKLYRYRRTFSPQIIAVINDDELCESLKDVFENLRIKLVGRNGELYSKCAIESDGLLYKAWLCDCAYCGKELGNPEAFGKDSQNFFKNKEVDIRSNMAYAIHIEYKIYDWLGMNPREKSADEIEAEGIRRFDITEEAKAVDILEHSRWNAFQRSEGMVCPFAESEMKDDDSFRKAAEKFKKKTEESAKDGVDYEKKGNVAQKPQRSIFSKEHGCIIAYNLLGILGEVMTEDEQKFLQSDRDIDRKMFEIRRRGENK